MAVTLHTSHGDIKLEVFCDMVPKTAEVGITFSYQLKHDESGSKQGKDGGIDREEIRRERLTCALVSVCKGSQKAGMPQADWVYACDTEFPGTVCLQLLRWGYLPQEHERCDQVVCRRACMCMQFSALCLEGRDR